MRMSTILTTCTGHVNRAGPGPTHQGGPVITSFDVARLAGVSQPTVSRALRDSDKVSEKTK
ncbi:MAG TPA: LacI family DNA-binding transcriptional regulator, partial [Lapillicoccus sp.]